MKKLLTISLLCSGREKTTKDCLDSLVPILEGMDAELIIVDTGCDDRMNALLHQYTDRVVKFEWCDDFASARNAGLELARGEWFLFVDDDEWFEDASPIIEFFTSGRYREYGMATYMIRNYYDKERKDYADLPVQRILRLEEGARFHGLVHEVLMPVKGRRAHIDCLAFHSGYMFLTQEDRMRHSLRNAPLLLEMMRREPDNMRWPYHLLQEYYSVGEFDKLREHCKMCLQKIGSREDADSNTQRASFYLGAVLADRRKFDEETAEKDVFLALADKRNSRMSQAALFIHGAGVSYHMGDYERSLDCCRSYLEIYRELKDDAEAQRAQRGIFLDDVFDLANFCGIYFFEVNDYLMLERDEEALEALENVDLMGEGIEKVMNKFIMDLMDIIAKQPYRKGFSRILEVLMRDKKVAAYTMNIAEMKMQKDENHETAIIHAFAEAESDHHFVLYMSVRDALKCGRKEGMQEKLQELFCHAVDFLTLNDEIWNLFDEDGISLEETLKAVSKRHFMRAVNYMTEEMALDEVEKRCMYIRSHTIAHDDKIDYLDISRLQETLTKKPVEEWEDYGTLFDKMHVWTEKSLAFYRRYYRPEAFEGEMEALPEAICLASRMELFFEVAGYDYRQALEIIRDAIGTYSPMDGLLQAFSRMYGTQWQRKLESGEEFRNSRNLREMETLEAGVRQQIAQLRAAGRDVEADEVEAQLADILAKASKKP